MQEQPLTPDMRERLSIPFAKGTLFTVTEGWRYSKEETAIHGEVEHDAIDLAAKEGTPVYAPMDGLCFGGLQLLRKNGYGMGGGFFVEIVAPDGLRVQLCHLQRITPAILYHRPYKKTEEWFHPFQEDNGTVILPESKPIRKGSLVGYVGHSGLADKGVTETPLNAGQGKSWDEDHVHLWVGRRDAKGRKTINYDPCWLYSGDLAAYNALLETGKPFGMWADDGTGHVAYAH